MRSQRSCGSAEQKGKNNTKMSANNNKYQRLDQTLLPIVLKNKLQDMKNKFAISILIGITERKQEKP